jgi:hypothetical protein
MNLDRSMVALSITDTNRGYFKLLDSIRPNHISFSQFLGVSASEYHEKHKGSEMKITDFANKDMMVTPLFYSEINMWKKYVDKMPKTELKKFQKRHQQLDNIINKKLQEMIG